MMTLSNMPLRLFSICIIGWLLAMPINAKELYPFKLQSEKNQFHQIISHLRCLVCQNQSLEESHSMFAIDIKKYIYDAILKGQTKKEIMVYLEGKYGDYILFKPKVVTNTYFLWYGPFLFLVIGFSFVWISRKGRTKRINRHELEKASK